MIQNCTLKNTYFWHSASQLEERHQYVCVGSSNDPDNIPVDQKRLLAIRGKVIHYNKSAHKTGLKKLLDSEAQSFVRKEREWQRADHTTYTAIGSLMAAILLYGVYRHTSIDTDFDEKANDGRDFFAVCLLASLIFAETLHLQSWPPTPPGYQKPFPYLYYRCWKVMKLNNVPSPAERLFREAMRQQRPNSLSSRIIDFLSQSPLQHPTLQRAMTVTECGIFIKYLGNSHRDDKFLDPCSSKPIASEHLWTSRTVTVNRKVYNLFELFGFYMKNARDLENIPHPEGRRSMNSEEKETFSKTLQRSFA